MKKRLLAILLAMTMVMALAACGGQDNNQGSAGPTPPANNNTNANQNNDNNTPAPGGSDVASSISLWVYPVGGWGEEAKVKPLLDAFTDETGISVQLEYLAYADGDDRVNAALTANNAPDLVMEGPERLVANWGVNGHMVDLRDMLDATDRAEIIPAALDAGTAPDGSVYLYPMFITAHCMAVNLNAFKEAGADQYLNLDTHLWTVEQFDKAVAALYDYYGDTVGAVYCGGQGGDQGTRALVTNRRGGTFTNTEHTAYTWDDPKNVQAIQELYALDGIAFDASLAGGDEITLFYQGVLKMAFCWNAAQQLDPNTAGTGAGKTMTGDEIVYMGFPSESGTPILQGGIWGLGIFDSGDQARINAAKEFIKYMCDSEHAAEAAVISNFFAARSTAEGAEIKAEDPLLIEYYDKMMPYLGDYYQITTGWAGARTEWWNMLQRVGAGDDVASTVAQYAANANAAAAAG